MGPIAAMTRHWRAMEETRLISEERRRERGEEREGSINNWSVRLCGLGGRRARRVMVAGLGEELIVIGYLRCGGEGERGLSKGVEGERAS
jgi:hypothetical protein